MISRLLALGPTDIDKFTLTKEAIELVDKEFTQVMSSDIFAIFIEI